MIVVVGGQCRNVGKTTVICEIIRRFRSLEWIAVKISRHSHRQQGAESTKNDTARYLEAGAREAHLLRGPTANSTLEFLRPLMASGGAVVIESNSILDFLQPDYYVLMVDARQADVKDSARRFVPRADAVVSCFSTEAPEFAQGHRLLGLGELIQELDERVADFDREAT